VQKFYGTPTDVKDVKLIEVIVKAFDPYNDEFASAVFSIDVTNESPIINYQISDQ
jgi:hypothetical protein